LCVCFVVEVEVSVEKKFDSFCTSLRKSQSSMDSESYGLFQNLWRRFPRIFSRSSGLADRARLISQTSSYGTFESEPEAEQCTGLGHFIARMTVYDHNRITHKRVSLYFGTT
jgi:hypothetical protein